MRFLALHSHWHAQLLRDTSNSLICNWYSQLSESQDVGVLLFDNGVDTRESVNGIMFHVKHSCHVAITGVLR